MDVDIRMDELSQQLLNDVWKSLAMLALQERRADILKRGMDRGEFPYEAYFEDEANTVDEEKNPETFQVVETSDFPRLYPKPDGTEESSDSDTDSGVGYNDDVKQFELARNRAARDFGVGGRYPVYW